MEVRFPLASLSHQLASSDSGKLIVCRHFHCVEYYRGKLLKIISQIFWALLFYLSISNIGESYKS